MILPDKNLVKQLEEEFSPRFKAASKRGEAWEVGNRLLGIKLGFDDDGDDGTIFMVGSYAIEGADDIELFTVYLSNLASACGIVVMHDGELEIDADDSYGSSYIPRNNVDMWCLITELVQRFARLQDYGAVLATDSDAYHSHGSDKVAKKLGIPIIHKFTSPRTHNKIHVYLADVSKMAK